MSMHTAISQDRLKDPMLKMSSDILRKCVHCGMCLATCPSYLLLGDELDSPRGRIYQIKTMLEENTLPPPSLTKHMDRCLSCLNCVTTCPSGVDYAHLADFAREQITINGKRTWHDRLTRYIIATILPNHSLMKIALPLGRIAKKCLPLIKFSLPKAFVSLLYLLPRDSEKTASPKDGVYEAQTTPEKATPEKITVALLPGCVQQSLQPSTINAAIEFLTRNNIKTIIANTGNCCGALTQHMGYAERARAQARKTIDAWLPVIEQHKPKAILHIASGCGTAVKDYAHLFGGEQNLTTRKNAETIASLAQDISEFVYQFAANNPIVWRDDLPNLRITYHSACSLRHGQRITRQPVELLQAAGFAVCEPAEAHLCCGSAGTYNIFQPELAESLKTRKMSHILATEPDIIVSGNIGCNSQLRTATEIPIVHTIELLNWASGGTMPEPIRKLPKLLANAPKEN